MALAAVKQRASTKEPEPPKNIEPICTGLSDIFYGDYVDTRDEPGREEREEIAKDICAECPLQFSCLAFALINNEKWGVWGGFTPGERRRFRKFLWKLGYEDVPTNGELISELIVFEKKNRGSKA